MTTKAPLEIPPYTGWRPYHMRVGSRGGSDPNRGAKRSRLGNRQDRKLYVSAKGHLKDPARFQELSDLAKHLNGQR